MRLPQFLIIFSVLFFGLSCEIQEEHGIDPNSEFSFYITGIKESVSYTFHSGNERISSTPDEVRNLTVLIFDANEELVHERRYNKWYDEGIIPDSIFIPALATGSYTIYAVTLDYYNYWHYEDDHYPNGNDSTHYVEPLTIDPYTVSEGPIYVGSVAFTLEEDEQHVLMEMTNISSKITIKSEETVNGWLDVGISTDDCKSYDLRTESFIDSQYGCYVYMYIDNEQLSKNFYILPQTLTKLEINYYDYQNYKISPKIVLDPSVAMSIGDAITFNMDINALLEGSGSGVFEWEDITWNDLGELNIP